jgi:hypothetical protein
MLYTVSHHLLVHLLANFSPYSQKTVLLAHTAADFRNATHSTELFEYFVPNVGRFLYNIIIFIYLFINCNLVVTRWQYTFTHEQYIKQHK